MKAFENGVAEPERVAPLPDDRGAGRRVDDGVGPAHPVHVLLARRRCRRPRALSGRRTPTGTPSTPVFLDAVTFATRHYGSFEVFSPSLAPERADGPTIVAARAAFEQAGIGPERDRRRPDPGHRVGRRDHAHGRDRAVQGRRAGAADPVGCHARSVVRCRSTPTAVASPTASRSARPGCARSTRTSSNSAATAGTRQVPGRPAGRLHARVRRARRQRLHGDDPMSDVSTDGLRPETAPVRAGEELDWASLERYLRAEIDGLDGAMEVLQFPNGSANLTYLVRFGDRRFVVRRPPFGQHRPGRPRHEAGVPHPVAPVAGLRAGAAGLRLLRRPLGRSAPTSSSSTTGPAS